MLVAVDQGVSLHLRTYMRSRKKKRHIGSKSSHNATAAVCNRRCEGICNGANLQKRHQLQYGRLVGLYEYVGLTHLTSTFLAKFSLKSSKFILPIKGDFIRSCSISLAPASTLPLFFPTGPLFDPAFPPSSLSPASSSCASTSESTPATPKAELGFDLPLAPLRRSSDSCSVLEELAPSSPFARASVELAELDVSSVW